MPRLTRRALISSATAAILLGIGAVSFVTPACQNDTCEFSFGSWGGVPGQGDLFAPHIWESTPVDAPWIPYPGQRWLTLNFGNLLPNCTNILPTAYISADQDAAVIGNNYTLAGGNVAEWANVQLGPGFIVLFNNSCGDYFVRVTIECSQSSPDGGDAGDADASSMMSEAGVDSEASTVAEATTESGAPDAPLETGAEAATLDAPAVE